MTRGGPESGRPFILTSDVVKVVKVILVKMNFGSVILLTIYK